MQAPNKKSLIAAAAAPFALTLALGAAPAYAEGNGNQNQSGQPNASATENTSTNSQAKITIAGCDVSSDKEISYVEYFRDGESVMKKEDVNSTTFTLDASLEFDSVAVKSGTTVTTGGENCSIGTEGAAEENGDDLDDKNEPKDDEAKDDEAKDDDKAAVENDAEGEDEAGAGAEVGAEVGADVGGENESDQSKDQDDKNENAGGGRDNNDNSNRGNDDVAGAEAKAGADVRGNASAEVQGNASVEVQGNATTVTPDAGGDAVLGAEGETQAYQPTAADGSTQYLPNTGAEENAALIAGGAGLAGLGAWMMLKRRRFGLER